MSASQVIQNDVNTLERRVQTGTHDDGTPADEQQMSNWTNDLASKRAELEKALEDEALQKERIDAQAEKIETITLAYDYNEILGNPMANETIIENVKQFQLQAYEEHNAEVARINNEWQSRLTNSQNTLEEIASDRTFYINDNNRLKDLISNVEKENDELISLTEQLRLERQEAEQGRDNAAQLLVEANEELEKHKQSTIENCELRKEIEDLKLELTAKKAITVSGNEKLAELAAKAKESTAAAAQRGIDRWNQQYGMDIPVLEVPEVQPVNAVLETVEAAEIQPFPEKEVQATDDTGIPTDVRDSAQDTVVGPNEESEVVTRAEFNELKGRVDILFNRESGKKEAA